MALPDALSARTAAARLTAVVALRPAGRPRPRRECLRSALPRRKREVWLRAVVHNLMLGRADHEFRD